MNPKADMQRCGETVLSAKMWLFTEIVNIGLPVERPDAELFRAECCESCAEACRCLLDAEQQIRSHIDRLSYSRIAARRPRDIPAALHYWYWIRLTGAQELTRMIMPYDHSHTIFCLPPRMTKQEMLRWLLTSWWADGGIDECSFRWMDFAKALAKRKN